MKQASLVFLFLLITTSVHAAVVTTPVEYTHEGATLEGYLAYDDSITGKRPGVLVVHEWRGLNDYAKGRARQLAELGYVAFAVDMYGKGVYAADHQEAAKLSGVYRGDRNLMRSRVKAGYEILKNHELVESTKTAAIGYCFGGSTVLEMARGGMDVQGVVSFHGGLSTPMPAEAGSVRTKILVLHGDADKHASKEEIATFQEEMRASGADWQFVSFGGVMHSFTVPDANLPDVGIQYDERADKRSWKMMRDFLDEIFGG